MKISQKMSEEHYYTVVKGKKFHFVISLFSLSILKGSFAKYSNLKWQLFTFISLNMPLYASRF